MIGHSGHELDDDLVCPKCGWGPRPVLPAWVKTGAIFAIDGKVYRVVNEHGSNNYRTGGYHFEPYVTAEPVNAEPWAGLPPAPCPKAAVVDALSALQRLPHFYVSDLSRALRELVTGAKPPPMGVSDG